MHSKKILEIYPVVFGLHNKFAAWADLLWIETEKPNVEQIAEMVNRVREVRPKPNSCITTPLPSIGH
ncbi:MAG: hypothetical protein Ct9H90mP27_3720 [Gammaproteobacteria bacterium]|nr:MAG: hypothetical protein Ct9H90mP27_3720 [Gammaproteobacteria bacterium]